MKLKVTNIYSSPYLAAGTLVEPGKTVDIDVSDAEAKNLAENTAVFKVEGYTGEVAPAKAKKDTATVDNSAADARIKELETANAALIGERDAYRDAQRLTREQLGIADGDSIFDAIAALSKPVAIEPLPLADAVKALDDKNDAHWIQSGKPNLDHLKHITGNEALTRAEVDALERVRATN